jgi:hypothetical protein
VKRAILASGLALAGTAAAYGALGALAALAGGWTREVAPGQAVGLALHAAVVFVRGVLPTVLLTSLACARAARRGRDPGPLAILGIAGLAAAFVFPTLLTLPIGDWPRLQVTRLADGAASIAALALAGAAAVGLARRIAPPRRGDAP